jgi:hypothetical protein
MGVDANVTKLVRKERCEWKSSNEGTGLERIEETDYAGM